MKLSEKSLQAKKMLEGIKHDQNKVQYSLIPPTLIEEVVQVLMYGARKYAPENWKYVPNYKERYYDACRRHLEVWRNGEGSDPETGLSPIAHAICCLIFILWRDKHEPEETSPFHTNTALGTAGNEKARVTDGY